MIWVVGVALYAAVSAGVAVAVGKALRDPEGLPSES